MRTIFFSTFILFSISIFSQSHLSLKQEQIDSLLNESHHRGFFNGNALVEVDGKTIYQSEFGYADSEGSEKLTADHIFKIGSIAKEFDGVAIMLLIEQGKLSMNDKVSGFFPELPVWSNQVSVKNLLQYTSGLPRFNNQTIRTDEQVWAFLNVLDSLAFKPGTDYLYNNLNTFLRKRIVEKVSGESFSDYVTTNLLKPAGIKNAIIDPESNQPGMAEAFDVEFVKDDFPPYMSGWVALNISDLKKWIGSLHSGKIIRQNSLKQLFENYNNKQSTLGSSVFENGKLHYQYHHGQSGSYEASFYHNTKEEFTVIFLTNQKGNNVGDLTNAVDAILRGEEFSIPKKSIELSLRSKILNEDFEAGLIFYDSIKKNSYEIYNFKNEQKELLETAEYLASNNRKEDAIKILKLVKDKFPDSEKALIELEKLQTKS